MLVDLRCRKQCRLTCLYLLPTLAPSKSHLRGLYFFQYCGRNFNAVSESIVYLSFLPFELLIFINILLLSISSGLNFTISPILNPAEYNNIKITLCLILSTESRIFQFPPCLKQQEVFYPSLVF